MRRFFILTLLLSAALLLAAACGGDDDGNGNGTETPQPTQAAIQPIPGNSELVVGPNRFAVAFVDAENEPILESAGTSVDVTFSGPSGAPIELPARFVWAIPDVTGFWVADVDFEAAGTWEGTATVTRDGAPSTVSFTFPVLETGNAPVVGAAAPQTKNLTLTTEPNIQRISTDPEPHDAFYQLTITDALQDARPFVVVFATPAFCETRFCGPVLDNVKAVQPEFADRVNFIHIEPFELDDEGQLVTTPLPGGGADRVPVQSVVDWNLQSEPWVFVVGADGTISARFEGAASVEELQQALEAALG